MNIELVKNIAIGRYLPVASFVHRLDPRTKLLCGLFLLIAVSVSHSVVSSLGLLLFLLLLVKLSNVPYGYLLRSVRASLPAIILFFGIAQIYLGWQDPPGRVFFDCCGGWIRITRAALQLGAISLIRLVSLVLLLGLPSLTTPITQLSHGLELLLMPFRRIGVPAHEIALMNTIALRFVPTLAMELEGVAKAQASRLGEIGSSGRRPDKLVRSLLPLIVPLFVNAFRRAEELAIAMEARGYVSGGWRTKYVEIRARPVDYVSVLVVLAVCALLLLLPTPPLRALIPGL